MCSGAPLVGVQLANDTRSRSRRLAPELAGSIGIGAVAAVIMLAGGGTERLAGAVWMVLAARAVTAIITVHGSGRPLARATRTCRPPDRCPHGRGRRLGGLRCSSRDPGSVAVVLAIGAQRLLDRGEVPRPVVLGLRQTALGLGIVLATALGAK